jgi:RHS repeat-associated protein
VLLPATLTSTYTYDPANNHLATVDGVAYSYDDSGNLLNNLWSYDARGRLASATLPSGVVYNYRINGLGQRVSKTSTALSTGGRIYVYDEAGHLVGEYNNAGAPFFEHVYLGDFPVAVIASSGTVFPVLSDHLGTPRQVINSAKQLRWRWDNVDPFGANAASQNPSGLGAFAYNLRFPGQFYDAETGLFYNIFRDYSPSTGRYIESDPIGLRGGVNTYAYVGGNPLSFVDHYGLAPGDYPPAPPGYNPDTWNHGKWSNGKDYLTDPDGNNWTVHPEDKGHWPHWDVGQPGGKTKQYPKNAKKTRPGQKKPNDDQSETNPNGPDKEPYCSPDNCPQEVVPVIEGAAVIGGSAVGGYIIWKVVKVCLCTWIATPAGGVACAITP